MSFFQEIKNYLWRPFEMKSTRSFEKIERELTSKIIQEPKFHWLPYYEKLVGRVENGRFEISFTPNSSRTFFYRGARKIAIQGKIENSGKGSRIYGRLPGPRLEIWILSVFSLFCLTVGLFNLSELSQQTIDWVSFSVFELILIVFTLFLFRLDRASNQKSEEKILALLKDVASK